MAKYIPDAIIDTELDAVIDAVDRLFICSAQPTTYAQASVALCLATINLVPADITKANGDASGRKATLGAKSGIVSADGTANHYALGVSGTSTLRLVGTTAAQVLVTGSTVNFPATDVDEIRAVA